MECLDAQRLVSEALDREPVDATVLEEAKTHCRQCPDCQAFVRALAALHKTPGPAPSPDLADRVMARVLEEHESRVTGAAVTAEAAHKVPSIQPATAPADDFLGGFKAAWNDPQRRIGLVGWATAAAVALVFAGVIGSAGVGQILGPKELENTTFTEVAPQAAPPAMDAAAGAASSSAAEGARTSEAATATAPGYVVYNGLVFREAGASTYARSNLTSGGTLNSALADPAQAPQSLGVLSTPDKNRVVVQTAAGELIVFELVVRKFGGNSYVLASAPIERYGVWPTMPAPMTPPTSPGGMPGYTQVGTSEGITAFTRSGSTVEAGIAIPPNTPPTDPAAANPNWTWWVPRR